MKSRKKGDFEFTLGKFGLTLFTVSLSLLILFSFMFGVMVGKNIDSYPEKIARGLPQKIKDIIIPGAQSTPKKKDSERSRNGKESDEFKLTFYDTLTDEIQREEVQKDVYTIQVASFRDFEKTKALADRLKKMNFSPEIDKLVSASNGIWFRVKLEGFSNYDKAKKESKFLESKIRGLKCLIIKNTKQ
jgi:hypothetical protein